MSPGTSHACPPILPPWRRHDGAAADKREAARAERRRYPRCLPSQLPGYLRRELGLGPFTGSPTYLDRW